MSSATNKGLSYMAKPQLYKIFTTAKELYSLVQDGEPLEDWIETKLAIMSDDIGNVYDSLKYRRIGNEYAKSDAYPSMQGCSDFMEARYPSMAKQAGKVYEQTAISIWDKVTKNGIPEHLPECVQECALAVATHEMRKCFSKTSLLSENSQQQYDIIPAEIYMHMLAESIRGGRIVCEALFKGKKVKLNKPKRGGSKKFYVYVNSGRKDKDGNVIAKKVSFGDPNMSIKRDDPERRSNFRKRHKCDSAKDPKTARYWSCRFWSKKKVSDMA